MTARALKRLSTIPGWDKDDLPKYGIKPAMHYTKEGHLLSLSAALEGRHYD